MKEFWFDLRRAGWKANVALAFAFIGQVIWYSSISYVVLHFIFKYW